MAWTATTPVCQGQKPRILGARETQYQTESSVWGEKEDKVHESKGERVPGYTAEPTQGAEEAPHEKKYVANIKHKATTN